MSNKAAWLTAAKARPFVVGEAPMPTPEAHDVVVRSYAAAIKPVDWKMQEWDFVKQFPTIAGTDAAGEIAAVGSAVTRFKKGDRVIAYLDALAVGKSTRAGFQLYCATTEKLVSKLPSNISYTQGVVLPLSLSAAAAGLFQDDNLALSLPQENAKPTGQVVLIWGSSSSVGSSAIQLAKAAGLEVATTASSHNHDYCTDLGAKYVFDHTKSTIVDDIVSALKGKVFTGVFDAISVDDSLVKSGFVASQLGGNKFISAVRGPPGWPRPQGLPDDVKIGIVFAPTIVHNEVSDAVWGKYVPKALADGTLKCKPDPLVIGQGLDKLQEGCDLLKKGVSARKIVVELP